MSLAGYRCAPLGICLLLCVIAISCENSSSSERSSEAPAAAEQVEAEADEEAPPTDQPPSPAQGPRADEREQMVSDQIEHRGVEDKRVLEAMRAVPRHKYVPDTMVPHAYLDRPLPIGLDQTISQPFIVALMSELLEVSPGDRVLEIGTGSGYQAAVLAEMGAEVFTIEILCELAERAERDLQATGYEAIEIRCGDGYKGWPEEAPFDRIIVTAAPPELPEALVDQLDVGGRLVVPVGEHRQMLQVVERIDEDTVETSDTMPVRFVPMVPGSDVD